MFQDNVKRWFDHCFKDMPIDKKKRAARFFEEATELAQAAGLSKGECETLIHYTFARPIGSFESEVGGTLITLSCLCTVNDVNMQKCAQDELKKNWENTEKIRNKAKNAPYGVLPK